MPDPIFDSVLLSMCMTWRHDFGLLDRKEQMAVRIELLGLYKHHVKPAIDRAKAAEFTAHTFSVACDAHKRRAERAESCLRRVQRLADYGVDDPAGPYNVLAQIANTAEVVLSSPPADASKIGGDHSEDDLNMVGERERRLANALRNLLALYEDDEGCRDIQEYKDGIAALAEMEQKS